MLTTLLDRLGILVSRQFVVSYFVPVLVFSFLNGILLAWQSATVRQWAPEEFAGFKALNLVVVLIGLAVIAYGFLSVNVYLRQVLEGRRLLPETMWKRLAEKERRRRQNLSTCYETARNEFLRIDRAKPEWKKQLITASDEGHAKPSTNLGYPNNCEAARLVAELLNKRDKGDRASQNEISLAVAELSSVLKNIDREREPRLGDDYESLLDFLDNADVPWNALRIAKLNQLQTEFGINDPLPTRMGNIASALEGYAQTRYRMNLETFWNRMQPAVQSNEKFYGMLLDAKCQLDFLVLSCWLSVFTAMVWLVLMPWLTFSWTFYLVISVGVPLLAKFFYQLALENYIVFADLVKSAVDLFRFQLLDHLHIPLPSGIREERDLWAALEGLSQFGKEGLEIGYRHEGT
jgi:hypothetical protein